MKKLLMALATMTVLAASTALPAADAPEERTSWPTLAGDLQRTGYSPGHLKAPGSVKWSVALDGERIGTAVEPIVADGRVFIPTHSGGLWALDAETGKPLWRFQAAGPIMQSPMLYLGQNDKWFGLFFADAAGVVYCVYPKDGFPRWIRPQPGESFCTSPVVLVEGWQYGGPTVVIGSRSGRLLGLDAATGDVSWTKDLGFPIRQSAAVREAHEVFIAAEDLRLRCVTDGVLEWVFPRMSGQSVRDYYPVVNGETVYVRTSPRRQFSRQLAADTKLLCGAAGIDASDWKKIDAWTKDANRNLGTPQLWEKERSAMADDLEANPDAKTFFAFDGSKPKSRAAPAILWAGGCQGVAAPPALTRTNEEDAPQQPAIVEYRTAYGNWNHGVAPLVAVGLLDPDTNTIEHLNHSNGTPNAPWNTYWGTADEAKHFQVVGDSVVITHQGTLCLFDLKTKKLATIQGDRDTFGGYPGLPWARNEWHGPARGGAAVVGHSLYWISGSRIFRVDCDGVKKPNPPAVVYSAKDVPAIKADPLAVDVAALHKTMQAQVAELIGKEWAPHACIPGLAGVEHSFKHSGEVIEALAWAWPHLADELRAKMPAYVQSLLQTHPPLTDAMRFDLNKGERREILLPPDEATKPRGDEPKLDPFGNVAVLKLFAERSGDKRILEEQWPAMQAAFTAFEKSHWKLDAAKGHLYANRYLASLLAYAEIAKARGDDTSADRAAKQAKETAIALAAWWKRAAAEQRAMAGIDGVAKLDQFISKGAGVFFALSPHRHKVALFKDLSPAVLDAVRKYEPDAPRLAWEAFLRVAPTWYLIGEERQVHSGENAYDPPDFSLDAFRAACVIGGADEKDRARYADMPWGKADLYFIMKAGM